MLNSANGNFVDSIPDNITNFLQNQFDLDRLKVQLCMIPDMIKTAFDSSVKKVTNVRTISSAMLQSGMYLSNWGCYISVLHNCTVFAQLAA